MAGLAASLAELGGARLDDRRSRRSRELVPAYVALPRGIARAAAEMDMVARPPLRLSVEPMRSTTFPTSTPSRAPASPCHGRTTRSARSSRPTGWRTTSSSARGHEVVAYAGIWLMVDEAHITTFAVLPDWRRHGIGGRLLVELMRLAADLGARVVTLEVRLCNQPARALYQRFGFRPVGVRPRYYSDNGEDALIMTTTPLRSPEVEHALAALAKTLWRRRRR